MAISKSLKDIIKSEFKKCAIDPVYFMRKYCQIQHPTKGKINFNLYDFQKKALTEFNQFDYNIILKSRQLGISTLCAGYSLWTMLFHSDKNILVIATKQEVAKNLVTKVRVMHDNLPSWLKGKPVEDNKLSLRLSNGSQIKATSSSGDAGRSEALSLLVVDEAAFIDNIEPIWASSQQTLATGGKAIILSTPNGTGNFFHKTWADADAGGEFNPIRLHWSLHPERDQSWRDKQDELLGPKLAAQECDCDFITSGHSVVDGVLLKWYEETYCSDPIEKRGIDSNYWIWELPDYSKDYIVVADVARGDGGDYSAFHIIEVESITQVAEYRGKIGTKEYGNMLVNAATEYNDALLVVENANIGWAAIQPAIDRGYRNLFYSAKDLSVVDVQSQLNKGYDLKDKSQMIPGFTTTSKTRPLIISKLDTLMREQSPIIKSKRLLDELYVFVWKGNRAEAQVGYNDDLV
ncbi:MAG TPA: hypothetical protein DF712_02715, partial [Balneola sp.]|nr:hypothetical protein [Balneola sp.]